MKKRWCIIAMLVTALVITAGLEFGVAADCFLKIDAIEGDSQDAKHKNEIQVMSWSWGETQTGTARAGGGAGAGRANFKDIIFTAKISKASAKLLLAGATGKNLNKALLTCRSSGQKQQEFLKIMLEGVMVSSYQTGGTAAGTDMPLDQFSLNYSKVKMDYLEQRPDGSQGGVVSAGFDLQGNKPY